MGPNKGSSFLFIVDNFFRRCNISCWSGMGLDGAVKNGDHFDESRTFLSLSTCRDRSRLKLVSRQLKLLMIVVDEPFKSH